MPPSVKEFFPTLTVSEGKVQGKEGKKSLLFSFSCPSFLVLETFNIFKSKCNTRTTTKRWIRTNISQER